MYVGTRFVLLNYNNTCPFMVCTLYRSCKQLKIVSKIKDFTIFFKFYIEVRIIFQFIVGLSLPDNPNRITLLIYKILKLHQRLKDEAE